MKIGRKKETKRDKKRQKKCFLAYIQTLIKGFIRMKNVIVKEEREGE